MPSTVIVEYDAAWPVRARRLLGEVRSALAPLPGADGFAYEHIGSTAVPGLGAKPGDQADDAAYEKRLFHSSAEGAILHIRRTDSPFARFVDFRDWLRCHPEQALRYEQIKRRLADEHAGGQDYDDYTRAKTAFFTEIGPRLRDWAAGS